MGRYAWFDTGFEYKFGFGILQSIMDIEEFGGEDTTGYPDISDCKQADYSRRWTQDDKEEIIFELKHLEEFYRFTPINFSKYTKDLKGTHSLYSELFSTYNKELDSYHYKYRLGVIILHQLVYTMVLNVEYVTS